MRYGCHNDCENQVNLFEKDGCLIFKSSSGLVLNEYCTGIGKIPVRDLELSALDADKTIAIYLKQEEKYFIFLWNASLYLNK